MGTLVAVVPTNKESPVKKYVVTYVSIFDENDESSPLGVTFEADDSVVVFLVLNAA